MSSNPCAVIRERFSPGRAMRAQRLLSTMVSTEDRPLNISRVVGVDVAYKRLSTGELGIGVAVVFGYPRLNVEECIAYIAPVCIPYIPGLLAFREMAVLGPALSRVLRGRGNLLVVDGHGISHPRRLGIASHLGVVFNTPSIGVAKKRLYGRVEVRDGRKVLVDDGGEVIAVMVGRVYVSPGTLISPWRAAELIESFIRKGYKLPEPIRVADSVSKELKSRDLGSLEGWIDCTTKARPTGLLDYI